MFTYEINIAVHSVNHGRAIHYARIQLNKSFGELDAKHEFANICARFPASDGFSLTLEKHPIKQFETIAYSEGA